MKNDIFLMATAIMAVWAKSNLKKTYGLVIAKKNFDILKVITTNKSSDTALILNIFGNNINFFECSIYSTFVPSLAFVEAARIKNVNKIVYLPLSPCESKSTLLEPFSHNFGMLIDLLSTYKIT